MKKILFIALSLCFFSYSFFAQSQQFASKPNGSVGTISFLNNFNSRENLAMVENLGQFSSLEGLENKDIKYFLEDNSMGVYFTSTGVIYKISKEVEVSEREWEKWMNGKNNNKNFEEEEKDKKGRARYITKTKIVEMNWLGANANLIASGENPTSFYFNYYMAKIDKDKVIGNAKGFKKIVYKNVYPNIDVEYTIHPEKGIKYSYILHPGADASQIKMVYNESVSKDAAGNIVITSGLGDILDHAPLTYKSEIASGKLIESQFQLTEKNTVGFKLADTKITETTIIDPWTVGPSFSGNYFPDDISSDNAGNVYVYSVEKSGPQGASKVTKHNSAGTLIWTFDLTTNCGYNLTSQGDIDVDAAGNSVVTIGLGGNRSLNYNTVKINATATALIWGSNSSGASTTGIYETWTLAYNCDKTKLYQAGGGTYNATTTFFNVSAWEPLNVATGAEGPLVTNPALGEIISFIFGPNGNLYYQTADSNLCACPTGGASVGVHNRLTCYNPTTNTQVFSVPSGYSYVDGDAKAPYATGTGLGSIGYNAIAAGCSYVYTMNGTKLDRWNVNTGAHYNQVTITGGSTAAGAVNSGMVVDKCGNVYVGSANTVYVYDQTLNLINTIGGLPGTVIDMCWKDATNTDLFVSGGTTTGTTFLADLAITACTLPNQVTITATQPVGCGGTGSATATPTFCGAPYTYSWSGGQTTQSVSGLPPGTYTVTVSSSVSCPYSYVETQTVTINAGAGGLTATSAQTNLVCNAVCAGSATVTPTSGTGPYTYTWSPSGGNSASAGSLCAGTYTCTIKDNVGCITTQTVSLTQPTAVAATSTVSSTCSALCAGTASVTASGGTAGYTYAWSPSGGTAATASSLCAGNYTCTITDSKGCVSTQSVNIASVPTPTVSVNSATICSGTSATLTASGGTTYTWTPSTGLSATTGSVVTATPGSTTTYTVTGTSSGCSGANTSLVTITPNPTITVNSPTICSGATTTLTASGGTTYTWTPPTGLSGTTGSVVTANPGSTTNYTVIGTSSGCSGNNVSIVTINPTPTVSVNNSTICPGNTATLTATGGTTYTWTPSTGLSATTGSVVTATPTVTTTYTITGTTSGCSGSTTATVSVVNSLTITANSPTICTGLSGTLTATGGTTYSWSPAGGLSATTGATVTATPSVTSVYTVTGTSGACSAAATLTVTVNTTPTVSATSSPTVICNGSSATLNTSGATTYTWSTGSNATSISVSPSTNTTYTVTGTSNGCDNTNTVTVNVTPLPVLSVAPVTICSGQSTTLSASGATTYTWSANAGSVNTNTATVSPSSTTVYTVSGSQTGCSGSTTVTVNVNPTPTVSAVASPVTICAGQSAVLTGSGAATYTWSANAGSVNTSTASVSPSGNTTYTLVGAQSGCSDSTTVAVNVTPLPVLNVPPATICSGQSTTLSASGATTYTWSANAGGVNTNTTTVSPSSTTIYTVSGSQSGCSDSTTVTVNVSPTPTVSAIATQTTICSGASTVLNASGALSYTWSANAGGVSTTTVSVSPGSNTTYTLIGNSAGCMDSTTVTVNVTPTPTLAVAPASICSGQSTILSASGATSYTWSANAGGVNTSTVSVSPSSSTNYTVIGGSGGCSDSTVVTVNVNPTPTITVNNSTICPSNSATLTATGGTSYNWSPPTGLSSTTGSTVTASPTVTTTYTITGTTAGCSDSTTATVTVVTSLTVTANSPTICSGTSGTITASGAATYSWSPAGGLSSTIGTTVTANPSSTTVYTVTGSSGSCSDVTTFTVTVNNTPTVSAAAAPVAICNGASTTLNSSGAVTYTWSANAGGVTTNTVTITPGSTDIYTVTGTDVNGCINTGTVNVIVNPLPTITVNSGTICAGQQTSTLTAGGANTYTWSTSANGGSITVSPGATTTYTVVGTDNNGCVNFSTATVTVNQTPTVTVNSATVCANSPTTLTAAGASIYSWTPSSTLSSGAGNPVTATPSGTTIYSVTGTDVNGCFGTSTSTVTVNALPVVTANAVPTSICAGQSTTLNGSGATTYTWSTNAGSSTSNTVSITPAITDSYTLTGTDINGCVNSAILTVTVNPLPTLAAVSSQTACSGASVNAINFTTSGGANVSWSNTNTNIGIGSIGASNISGYTAPNVVGQQTGIITATPVDPNTGCSGAAQTFTIVINPTPTMTGGILDSATCGLPTGGVTSINVSGGTPVYTYQWYNGSTPISGATQDSLTGVGIGTYSVSVVDANGCVVSGGNTFTIPGTGSVTAVFIPSPSTGQAPLPVTFSNGSTGANNYNWNLGPVGSTQTNPQYTYTTPGIYTVTLVASNGGCVATYTALVIVQEGTSMVIPNIYSPNGDGINDVFSIITTGMKTLQCDIFNRWGQKIYSIAGPNQVWDGSMDNGHQAVEGTYYYVLNAEGYDGKTYKADGFISLVK